MKRYIVLFFLAWLFWMLLTWSVSIDSVIAGAGVALLTTVIFGKYFYTSIYKLRQFRRFWMVIPFLAFFTWQAIKANLDVAWRVIQYKIPIRPAIIKTPLTVKTELARAILSCALTMTPGTIVIDIRDDFLYVHWIYVDAKDPDSYALNRIRKFERYIQIIFD
ncbi:MAG: hypothetical protein EA361_10115 [Bacteroidetes bacterium]|nr:MAG: hypothetical protein EA361_10115 [Bacteroidota bacterium]